MNVKMMQRVLALLLCLVLLVMAPVRAYATGLESVVGVAAVEALKVIVPVLVVLGVMVGIDQGVFENMGRSCAAAMTELGYVIDNKINIWIADGKSYVPVDLLLAVQDWLYSSGIITSNFVGNLNTSDTFKFNPLTTSFTQNKMYTLEEGPAYLFGIYQSGSSSVSYQMIIAWDYASCGRTLNIYDQSAGESSLFGSSGSKSSIYYRYTGSISNYADYSHCPVWYNYASLGVSSLEDAVYAIVSGNATPDAYDISTTQDITLGRVGGSGMTETEIETIVYINPAIREFTNPNHTDPDDPENKKIKHYPVSITDVIDHTITQDEAQTGETDIEPETETDPDGGGSSDSGSDTMTGTISQVQADTFWEKLAAVLKAPFERLGNMLLEGIQALFVPETDFLTAKVDAIRAEFTFADAIMTTGEFFRTGFADLGTEPPVIYIDLGATEGSYNIGGKVVFVDMSWYERYKPTGDAILASFLWIVFAWRMLIKVPGIISGMPGDFVMQGVHGLGLADSLPTRKKEYEIQRQSNRDQIRRGRG